MFIDNGKIIEGINDGQAENFYHGESFPNQNRQFIGEAIRHWSLYEYGEFSLSRYPGYRYDYPSIPIPRMVKMFL